MIQYITGDATKPVGEGNKLILHCCNNVNAWGAGFTRALNRWDQPKAVYRQMRQSLGEVSFAKVEPKLWVANIIGQDGIGTMLIPPVRYDALRQGFERCVQWMSWTDFSVHAPRIGCGLAGGDWLIVEALLETAFVQAGFSVTVYDLP